MYQSESSPSSSRNENHDRQYEQGRDLACKLVLGGDAPPGQEPVTRDEPAGCREPREDTQAEDGPVGPGASLGRRRQRVASWPEAEEADRFERQEQPEPER